MSDWLTGIKAAIEKEYYGAKETYVVLALIGNTWVNAGVLGVKSEYDNKTQADTQGLTLLGLEEVSSAMVVRKTVVCFSDIETKKTIKAIEWTGLLV